jgi:hypothetical protein
MLLNKIDSTLINEYLLQFIGILGNVRKAFLLQDNNRKFITVCRYILANNLLDDFIEDNIKAKYKKGLKSRIRLIKELDSSRKGEINTQTYYYCSEEKWDNKNPNLFNDKFNAEVLSLAGTYPIPVNENRVVFNINADYNDEIIGLITFVCLESERDLVADHADDLKDSFQELFNDNVIFSVDERMQLSEKFCIDTLKDLSLNLRSLDKRIYTSCVDVWQNNFYNTHLGADLATGGADTTFPLLFKVPQSKMTDFKRGIYLFANFVYLKDPIDYFLIRNLKQSDIARVDAKKIKFIEALNDALMKPDLKYVNERVKRYSENPLQSFASSYSTFYPKYTKTLQQYKDVLNGVLFCFAVMGDSDPFYSMEREGETYPNFIMRTVTARSSRQKAFEDSDKYDIAVDEFKYLFYNL